MKTCSPIEPLPYCQRSSGCSLQPWQRSVCTEVMAYTVTRRTKEIGIRIALGAERHNVLSLVLKEVTILTAVGIGLGVPAALGLSRVVRNQLFGLDSNDPLALILATATLAAVAPLAGYRPARRATRIDPLRALRYE